MAVNLIVKALLRVGERRPYFHIRGANGSLYMGRWWLFGGSARDTGDNRPPDQPRTWQSSPLDAWIGRSVAGRLHHIAREDRARDNHNHPASFVSVVLCRWYRERRPRKQSQNPMLDAIEYVDTVRRFGSIAFRRASDRHTITEVASGGCWTLVIWFRKQGLWGFWKQSDGSFVNWREYGVKP